MLVDSFRIITNTNTQTRVLPVLGQIMRLLSQSTLPEEILKSRLVAWSLELEQTSEWYRNHNGKITDQSKSGKAEATNAFEGYITLLEKLRLVSRTNRSLQNTKYGFVFCKLWQYNQSAEVFSPFEKVFFAWHLFSYDADILLLILDAVSKGQSEQKLLTEADLRKNFNALLKVRLGHKIENATELARLQSEDRYRQAEVQSRQDTEGLHKHLIPPRLEWLHDLGLMEKNRFLKVTNRGRAWQETLPILAPGIRDINTDWLRGHFTQSFAPLFEPFRQAQLLSDLPAEQQVSKVMEGLDLIWKDFDDEGVMRVPYQSTFLFIVFYLLQHHQIMADFLDLERVFQNDLVVGNKQYGLRKTARINESYVTLRLLHHLQPA